MKQLYFIDRKNIGKYIIMLIVTVFSVVSVLAINGVYAGYRRIQLENAYVYSGDWDVRTKGETPKLDLEFISYVSGPYMYVDAEGNSYDIYGCTQPEMETLFAYTLIQGRWPETDSEIVVSEYAEFEGKSYDNAGLTLGDRVHMNRFTEEGLGEEEEYTIVGFRKSNMITEFERGTYEVFTKKTEGAREYVRFYKLKDYSIKSVADAKKYFESGTVSGTLNDYLYRAVYNSYGSDYIRHVNNGIKILTWILVAAAVCIVAVNMTYVADSEKHRNMQLFAMGCTTGRIFRIYAMRLLTLIVSGCAMAAGITLLLMDLLGRRLRHVWHVFYNTVNIHDVSWGMLPVILILMFAVVSCYILIMIKGQIRGRKKTKAGIQRIAIKSTYDLAQINILHRKIVTAIFVISLSAAMTATAFVAGFSGKISDKIEFVTGNGRGYDFTIMSMDDILDEINGIEGVEAVYWNYHGNNMSTTTINEDNFVEQAKKISNYDIVSAKDTWVYVLGLTENYYEELSMFNDLPPYDEFLAADGCLVFYQFIDPEDGQVYDAFQWSGEETISLTSTENGKTITVTPIANVSMPDFDRSVDLLLGSFLVPAEKHKLLSETEIFTYDVYIDTKKDMRATALELIKLADKYECPYDDYTNEKIKQMDTYNTHILIAKFIEIIVLALSLLCIWSAVSLEKISRRKQYESYRLLGMSRGMMTGLIFAEYIHKLFDGLIIALIAVPILYNSGSIAKMAGFYSMELSDVTKYLGVCFVILLVVLTVISAVFGLYRKRKTDS